MSSIAICNLLIISLRCIGYFNGERELKCKLRTGGGFSCEFLVSKDHIGGIPVQMGLS